MARKALQTLPDAPRADVLVATADSLLREEVATKLWADGCRVREIGNEDELLDVLRATLPNGAHPALVVADARFAGHGIGQILSTLRAAGTPVLYVCAEERPATARGIVFRSDASAEDVYRVATGYLTS
jgi:DNA-binding response OmpR family regulator